MDIVIIGTGNTASVLGKKLRAGGHRIIQVYGRDSMEASALAYELGTESTNYWNVVYKEADLYLLAVSDIAIEEVKKELNLSGKTVVHTAAAVSRDALKGTSEHYGVFYPLQSLRKELGRLPDTPIIIDASDEATLGELDSLAHTISNQVVEGNDDERLKLHLAAVFCNNFVNHLYALAETYCAKEGLDFKLLLPLISETANRLGELAPANLQTGPAIRNDEQTIAKHLLLLEDHPRLKEVYSLMTRSIQGKL
jgi:predicted short-subunit dehydrogenase-like oxidoreductase (DUF2520 family)